MLRFLAEYNYNYNDPMVMDDTEALIVGLVTLAFLGIYFVIGLAAYIFQALSLYKMASRRGIRNPWLAWIPGGDQWIIGSISDQYQYVAKGKVTNRRKIVLWMIIAAVVLSFAAGFSLGFSEVVPMFAFFGLFLLLLVIAAMIAWMVFYYMALYDLFNSADPANGAIYLVVSILVNIALPILLFICRNKDGGMPPRKAAPVAETPAFVPAAEPVVIPVAEETPVEGFASPEEFVEEPVTEEPAAPETTEPAE